MPWRRLSQEFMQLWASIPIPTDRRCVISPENVSRKEGDPMYKKTLPFQLRFQTCNGQSSLLYSFFQTLFFAQFSSLITSSFVWMLLQVSVYMFIIHAAELPWLFLMASKRSPDRASIDLEGSEKDENHDSISPLIIYHVWESSEPRLFINFSRIVKRGISKNEIYGGRFYH